MKNSGIKYLWGIFTNGLLRENPLLVLTIGLCSTLAVSTEVSNAIGMGAAMTFVLLMSEIIISVFRKLFPPSIRMPCFIIIIATFTTLVDYVIKAYFPELSKSLGVFIPLIVVQCIIMGRAEAFAFKHKVAEVIPDALGMGLGYTWVLIGISAFRELLGSGTLLGFPIFPESYQPILFFIMPPGGFLLFGLFFSFNTYIKSRLKPIVEGDSDGSC